MIYLLHVCGYGVLFNRSYFAGMAWHHVFQAAF